MTWEDVYDVLCESAIDDTSPLGREVMLLLKAELGDCIIIKKGENRHPYADVIHAFAEGARTEIMENGFWRNYFPYGLGAEYRIKPSEPIVKYKYAYVDYDGNVAISDHVTEEYAMTHIINRTKATRLDWSIKND